MAQPIDLSKLRISFSWPQLELYLAEQKFAERLAAEARQVAAERTLQESNRAILRSLNYALRRGRRKSGVLETIDGLFEARRRRRDDD